VKIKVFLFLKKIKSQQKKFHLFLLFLEYLYKISNIETINSSFYLFERRKKEGGREIEIEREGEAGEC
jgi:hypothetical protein